MDQAQLSLLAMLVASFGADTSHTSPLDFAKERGWVDPDGRLTNEGSALLEAMAEQSGARSVFRFG